MSSTASSWRSGSQSSRSRLSSIVSPISARSTSAGAQRRRAHAAERQRRARDFAGGVFLEQRRRRDNGEIAVAAGKFDEGRTVPRRPAGKTRAGEKLVGPERRRHIGDRERGEIDVRACRSCRRPSPWRRARRRPRPARPPDRDGTASRRACRGCGSGGARPGRWPRASAGSVGAPDRRIRCRAGASSRRSRARRYCSRM